MAKKKISSLVDKVEDSREGQYNDYTLSSKKLNTKSNSFTHSKNKLKEEKYFNESRFVGKKPLVNVLWHHIKNKKILGIFLGLPVRRVLSVILSLLLILVTIASASIISLPVDSNPEILNVFVDPESVYEGDSLTVNVTIPNSYNIYSVTADFAGIETIDLLLVDNSSSTQLWRNIWVVHDMEVGEHVITISAYDKENTSFQANAKWNVLSQGEQTNGTGRNNLDELPYEENNYLNTNTSVINEENITSNQTVISNSLNVSLQNDKESYVVNESILINGNVSYNNSLINIPVNLLIFSPSYNSSVFVNATDGIFHYQITGASIGIYTVEAIVEYENQTASNKTTFWVLNESLDNVSLLATDLYLWDDTDSERRYSNDTITFFANYSSFNQSIKNATCFILFYIGSWTEPKIMNYSNGYYVYNRAFDVNGTYEFKVWCSSPGYENKSAVSNFFIYGNESTVFIVDPQEEHIDVVPGTSFYVERTVDGVYGTDIIFTALFSDALTLKKIEFVGNEYDYKEEIQDLMMLDNDNFSSSRIFSAGNPVSNKEKVIDKHWDKLPAELKQLDMIGHSPSFRLKGSSTVRIWFQTPSWEEITSGSKPASGQISYLVFSDDEGGGFDFESSTWWSSDWGYRKLITINSSQVNATLTNFPILVYNSSDSDLASHAQDDGDDIAFVLYSDNSTQLNHEIELFNGTTGELVAWVNVTSLSSSVDTKIWLYYGNSTCDSQENSDGVWDNNFMGVWHLTDNCTDSTNNEYNGTATGSPSNVSGKIGNAKNFNQSNPDHYVTNSIFHGIDTGNFTFEAWVNKDIDTGEQYQGIMSNGDYAPAMYVEVGGSSVWGGYWSTDMVSDHETNTSVWYHYVMKRSGSTIIFYRNGVAELTTYTRSTSMANATMIIASSSDVANNHMDGTIDEVRFSNIERNISWINTSYNTMNNTATFLKFGSEQQNIAPTMTDEIPSNQSIDVSLTPTLNVTVNDADEDTLTAYWYSNSSGSWVLFATNSSIDTSTGSVNITQTNNNFSNYSVIYYWSVNLTDGTNWHNETYHFTTESINTSVDSISPYELSSSPLIINATGPSDLNNVTFWYRYSSDNSSWGTWWNDSWTYCKLITINSSQVESNLTNFPVLIYKASDPDLADHAQDNGSDIAFVLYSDNNTQLSHEIEFFNGSTGEIVAWVNITELSSINDTIIWMYYGNSVCNCQQNKTGVWDSHYIGVWHLNETSGNHSDSTSNGYNSENIVGVIQDDIGKVDGGDEFDGDDDYIDITMNVPSNITISAWAQKDTDSADMLWCIDSDNNGPDLFFGAIDTGLIALNTWDSWDNPFCNVPANADQWHLYTTIMESGNTKLYIDDQLAGTADYRDPSGTSFHISSSAGYDWDGKIDEVRISDISRNSSWINTSYNTMNNTNTFLSFDSERKICTDWEVWSDTNNPDDSYPWGWDFNFPNGSGYYEFYSIGKKAGSADETPPASADTRCKYDNVPTIEVISPANGSTDVTIQPTCSIWANDTDGDTLTVYWYENTTDSWIHRQTNSSVSANSTVEWIFTQANSQAVKYWWKVAVNDSIDNTTAIFEFTTGGAHPTIEVISPANGSTDVSLQPICSIWANDTDGDTLTVYWYENTTDSWIHRQTNSSVSANSTVEWTFSQASSQAEKYWWKVAVNDGIDNTTAIFEFNTGGAVPTIEVISPANGSTDVTIQPTCNIWANDTDGDTLTVYWYENTTGGWVHRQTNSSVSANSTVEWIFTQANSQAVKYWWKVAVNDSIDNTTAIFEFTTGGAHPTIEVISPANGSTGVIVQPTCNIWANDTDGDTLTVYWYENTTDSWIHRQTNSSVSANSTVEWTFSQASSQAEKYWWKVAVNDGIDNTTAIFEFTTGGAVPTIEVISPANGTTGVSLQPTCNIWANDTDGDTLNVYWFENTTGEWLLRNTNSSVSANSTLNYTFTQFTNYSIVYYWKVAVNDGKDNLSFIYHFTTEPINTSVDTIIPYLVVSSPLALNATGISSLDNVTLWYRYSTLNSTWWNPSWTYRKILTIDHNQVSGNLENFPILVNITDSDLSTKAQSDGDDIAFILFSDNTTQLNHEIEFFNSSSGELSAWINMTALDDSNDTLIWMYYGNSACSSQENSTGVWESNYVMVQHLQETSGTHYDSTSNNNDGSSYGNVTQDSSGKIGGADSFNGYFDEYVHVDDAASLDITDDITVEAWMNVDSDANNVSDGLDIGEANVGEIIDEYYYGHGMCYNPDTVEVSSNVFATVYRSEYTELFLSTYQIDDNGVYNTIIDRFEVDEYGGYEPDIMHIGNDVFVIVYRSSTGQGIIKSVSISSDGTINGIIDAITYDEYAYYPNILHISGNVYVIQYAGPGDDGYIETYWIGSDGTLNQTNIDELYYDTSQGIFNSIVRVGTSDFYAMAREGAGGDGWLSTVQIDSSGNIAAAVADSVEYDVNDAWDNYLISTDSDSIALVYRTTGNVPWILTFNISTVDGSILTNVSDSLQFDTYGITPTITNISNNYFAITYTGPDSDGWIKTITITNGWDIGTIQDSGEWDITNGFEPNFYHISGNKYGITYRSNEESFEVATIDMNIYGQISGSPVDSEYVFDGVCYRPDMIHLTDDIYVIAYTGIDSDGYIKTVNISSSGTVVEVIDTVEFDTDIASYPDLYNVSSDIIAVAYYGTSEDGYIKTYQIFSNGTINSEAISEWEFDTSYGNTPEIFHISGDIYAIAYSGYGNDGFVFTFEIYSNGTINQSKIDSLEYATLYGLYQSVVRVGSTDYYAIANTGEGYDGWLHTIKILSNGSIDDNVTSSYEFNPTVGYTPNIIALSDNYYAIVYRGPDYDGYLQTVNIASDGAIAGLVEEINFDTTYGYTPIIQQINSNNFSIFYRGRDYDGWIKTVEITSSNGDIKEIQDSCEFDLYDAYEPSVCLLSSNIFAIAYRSMYYDGKLTTVEIKDNGQVSKSLDFSNYSYEQSLVLISETNRIYAVAYRGNETGENDGYIKTFQVLDTDGFINKTVIDTFEFEIYNCYDPKIIHIIENTYAIVYRGNDSDGYVTTVEIDNNGDVKQVNDTLEFDTVDCYRPDMIHVTGTIYAIFYRGSGSDPYITTVNISNDGQIVDTVVDSDVFDTAGYECKIINVSNNIFAIVYRGNDNDGWIKTVEIYDNGTINSIAIDSLEFDESDCYYPEIIHIYDEIYAIFYSSTGNDAEIVTLSITSAGQISDIVIDRLERIEDYFVDPEVVSIGNNAYAAVFTGPGDDGYLMTFNISNTGKIKNNDLDRFQFQVVRCYTPDILYMTENIAVLTYRGIDTHTEHGVFRTIRIYNQGNDIGVVNFSEILHEFYFVRGTCFLPETVEVSSNIFATSYTSDYYKLYLSTYKIDSDGIFNSTIDDFIIDDLGGFESNIININGNVYAIAYRLLDSALGILKTVNISSDGMINGIVDCLYFDVNCYYPDIIHISGDVYAIFYAGAGSDGHVRTFHIANNGTINTTIIDELEFDRGYGNYIDVTQVGSSDYYAIVYSGYGSDGNLSTVQIDSSGIIASSVIDSIEFDTDYCLAPQIIPTSGDSFAFVYRSQSNLGILNTVNISSVNGSILTNVSDSLQFEFEGNFLCNNPRILHISGNYYAIAYEGPDSDGWLKTFDITSGWNIGSVQDSVEWDLENGFEPNFYHISGNTYGITYRSNEYHFEVATVLIKSNGEITKDIVDSEYVYNHISYYPDMIHLNNDIYVIAYRGIDSDGYMRTIRMTPYGNIIEDLDEFEFDIYSCNYPDLYKLSTDKLAVAYSGYGTDGYIKTYEIFSNGTINSEPISEWEFDTSYGSTPDIFHISGDIYAIAYSGGGNDGFVFTFEMFSNGVINQTMIDSLEYDTVYGLYQSVVKIGSTDYYAIANTGDSNDGWLYTVEIASNGSIDDNVTSSYEFNQTVAYEPNIIALSDNYYAIVYRGPDNDGYLQTVNIASDGTILGTVEELEYDLSSGYEPILKHVSGDIYAIFYSGSGNDGWIKTVEITSTNGDIKEVQDSFEFEVFTCRYPSVLHISGDVYAISYYHSYEQGKLVTLKIRSDGEVSKWLNYSAFSNEQTMICVSETNDIYAVAYRGDANGEDDGYLKTIQVYDDEGFLNKTVIDTLEFDTSYCYEPKLFHINGDIFAIAYRGTDDDGYITTVEIASDGSITDSIVDTYEFDESACFYPDMLHVSDITYAIAYRGSGNDPYVTTVNITNSGSITKSVVSSSVFDTDGYWVRILHIDDDVYAITYSGPGNDGWLRTIQIYSNGTINSNDIDSLEFDSDYGYYANMKHICNQTYAIFYGGTGTDGEIITLNITSSGQIVPATENDVTDRLKKFEIYFGANEILNLGDHVYGAVFYGTGGDGTFQSFEISNTGIIKGNPLEWFEWDINYANYVKAIYIGNNTYVLTHRGSPTNQYEGVFRTLTIVTNKGICKDNAYGIDADCSTVFGNINGQSVSTSHSLGWNYIVLTYDKEDEQKLYLNGVFRSSKNGTLSIDTNNGELHIGQYFDGIIDEIRISSGVRNASWIQTSYNTMNSPSTFLSAGGEEINAWIMWNDASNPDTNSPWNWSFDFPNGTGYYEFYSIGKKVGSVDETPPGCADANCYWVENKTINVTPPQWNQGSVWIGTSNETTGFYFNITNEGNLALDILIKASNATNGSTGAQWNLTLTPGYNNFTLQYNKSGGGSWTSVNTTYDTFVTNLGINDGQTFDLKMTMATVSSSGDPMSFTIYFKSVAS